VNGWTLVYEGYDPDTERLREAICTLGNGYVATRGAAPEATAGEHSYPGTYLAGLYDRLTTTIAGREVENEDLVNIPNWLPFTFRRPGLAWFDPASAELVDYAQELHLQRGLLSRTLRVRDALGGLTLVTQRRIVSMADMHLAALETTFVAEDWEGPLEIRSSIDGRITNDGVARYHELRGDHLEVTAQGIGEDGSVWLEVLTRGSHQRIALAVRTTVTRGADATARQPIDTPGEVGSELRLDLRRGKPAVVEKVACIYTNRDAATYDAALEARTWIGRSGGFRELLSRHEVAWHHLWSRCDTGIEGPERAQLILRLHVFHLLQTVSLHSIDLDVGVPARGLHGEAYRGHIFWDELFILPFLNLRLPVLSRALLEYRHRRLPEARRAARKAGYRGAMFPWQSGSDGREESQQLHLNPRSGRWLPDHSHLQRHIGSAVAYNAWRYFAATGDVEFLRFRGAPLVIEVARFWSSAAVQEPGSDRFEIRGVMGPDEYHDAYPDADRPGLDNNAYTNVMAAWVLCRALEIIDLLGGPDLDELWRALELTSDEVERWELLSRRMLVPFHDGLISQFQGYENLAELDWTAYRDRYGDIQRLDRILEAEGDSPNRYRVSKQADVLMLFYLLSGPELADLLGRLGYAFDPAMDIERNVRYYLERTVHGSTLSRLVSAWVLARLDRRQSWASFAAALESDVADIQGGTTPEGIHLGAMAGTVDLVQRCYGGVEVRDDTLVIDPSLPDDIRALSLAIHYRGQRMQLEIRPDGVSLRSHPRSAPPAQVAIGDEELVVLPGTAHRISARP